MRFTAVTGANQDCKNQSSYCRELAESKIATLHHLGRLLRDLKRQSVSVMRQLLLSRCQRLNISAYVKKSLAVGNLNVSTTKLLRVIDYCRLD